MTIFHRPLLLVFFSILLCPVASQTGHTVKEVKSGHCTSADELIETAADCQAAAKLLGNPMKTLAGTVKNGSSSEHPQG